MRVFIFVTILFMFSGLLVFTARAADGASDDDLCHDIIITALMPAIDQAIGEHYNPMLRYTPCITPDEAVIRKIERPNGDRTMFFIIEVEVEPYLGPHITVGRDRVWVELSSGSPPKVLKFEHLEDYPIPEHKRYYLR